MKRIVLSIVCALICIGAMAVKPEKVQRYSPGAQKSLFISKGTKMGGLTISYKESDTKNMNITVLKNLNGNGYSFGVSPFAGYFFKDNQALGLRFNYDRTKVNLENLDLNLGEDFNINLDHIYYISNAYDVSAFWRVYMPIAQSKIFAVFNEARLCYGHTQGKNSTGTGTEYTGSYTTSDDIMLGVAPGITAFITDNAAIEVSVGLMGLDFKCSEQVTNQVSEGSSNSASARFKVDLLSLKLGMVVYF